MLCIVYSVDSCLEACTTTHPHKSMSIHANFGAKYSLCAIALGSNLSSNLGNSEEIVKAALAYLDSIPRVEIVKISQWYRTKAITGTIARSLDRKTAEKETTESTEQPDYINGCALLRTSLTPNSLLSVLLATEARFGRERRERWGARTLDLDLLLYEDCIIDTPSLIVPHPRMCDRAFVLLPLAEIAPDWIHPINGCTIALLALDPPDLHICAPQKLQTKDAVK
jgi:2-amino-4-hydroxy-6-hydroxymethyldihydropteridine diphosphokinase